MFIKIVNGELTECGNFPFDGYTKEIDLDYNEYINNQDKYIFNGTTIIVDPDYDEKQKEKEKERVSHLKVTKRVLVLMLQELQVITWPELKAKIDADPQAQLEWDLCVELERCNPLINQFGEELGLSPEQIDQMFKYANGEVPSLEVRNE